MFFSSYTLNSGGYVAKVSVCGGTVETVATAFVIPFTTPIALDANHVYFSWNDNTNPAHVMKCPKSGCTGFPTILATAPTPSLPNIPALAADSTNVYWLNSVIMKTPVGGGSTTTVGGTALNNFAIDATDAYWSNASGLWKCSLNGCANPTPVGPPQGYGSIVMDGINVYTADNSTVYSCSKTGCGAPTKLFVATGSIVRGLATDGTNVYWSDINATSGQVQKCSVGGCNQTPTVIVTTQQDIQSLALDGTSVYWITMSGKVMRANK